MQIFVKLPTGKSMTINCQPSDTVDEIKTKIHAVTGIEPGRQRLAYAGKDLLNGTTLAAGNVADSSTVQLMIRIFGGVGIIVCQQEAVNVVISVHIVVDHDTTVKSVEDDVRNSLERALGVKSDRVRLSYRGFGLRSTNTLQYYDIYDGDSLDFSVRGRH
ncbi:ubiquitin-related domain-containing protein [Annulohypoxylon moriforme]|nr:ubiquitin-related domain-containing protein [Annulohypoxylon moriforme]